jgi:dihydrofolate reductase
MLDLGTVSNFVSKNFGIWVMGNKTYGGIPRNRALSVFLALFDYVYTDLDNPPASFNSKDFE